MPRYTEEFYENKKFSRERGSGSLKQYVNGKLNKERVYGTDVLILMVEDRYNKGYVDCWGSAFGVPVAIELKVGNNKPTKLQEDMLLNFERAGAIVGVAYTWGDVKRIIEKARQASQK